MRSLILSILSCSALLAQAPASKSPESKSAAGKPNLLNPASFRAKAPDVYKAQFTTTKGDFVVEVHREWSPLGADRFYNLVRSGFFNDAPFFRVIKGFMAQFGLSAQPAVNKAWADANIHDEPVKQSNKRGYLTFAKSSLPNSRSTQIFINLVDNAYLDGQGFTPFGTVVDGMDVVDKIKVVPTGSQDAPLTPVIIKTAREVASAPPAAKPPTSPPPSPKKP
ncbi:MAG TPA: peptidylprolyl isomerase [Vicinamibacteria bacterium]|nr:peptidylprolyl isomerase [Vicinamibacteria bacterium]